MAGSRLLIIAADVVRVPKKAAHSVRAPYQYLDSIFNGVLEGQQRRVTLSFRQQDDPVAMPRLGGKVAGRGHVTVKPFFTCPEKEYAYTIYDRDRKLQCIASVAGFARPKFESAIESSPVRRGYRIIDDRRRAGPRGARAEHRRDE